MRDAFHRGTNCCLVLFLLTFVLCYRVNAAEVHPPPRPVPPIPSQTINTEHIIDEIARQAEAVKDPQERFRLLSWVLYHLEPMTPQMRRPILATLEETVRHTGSQALIGSGESLVLYAPDLVVRMALEHQDQRLRDAYLGDVVRVVAAKEPKKALELIEEIENPENRGIALLGYIIAAPVEFEQIRPVLERLSKLEWKGGGIERHLGSVEYQIAEGTARFAKTQPTEVSEALRKHLEPEEAVVALGRLAWILAHRLDASPQAQTLVDDAKALIPQAKKPWEAAIWLLHDGYDQLSSSEAGELFDAHILALPAIANQKQSSVDPLALLASVELPLLLSRARAVAKLHHKPLIEVLPKAFARAVGSDPKPIVDWLQSQPPSPLRAACLVEVASALQFRFPNIHVSRKAAKPLLATMTDLAADIEDDRARWRAYDSLLTIADNIGEPLDDLRNEWWALFQRLERKAELGHRGRLHAFEFFKLPLEEQERRLARRLDPNAENHWKHETPPASETLDYIGYSSLSNEKKERLYRTMAKQAEGNAPALSAISSSLAVHDFPAAWDLMWNSLPDPKKAEAPDNAAQQQKTPSRIQTALQWFRILTAGGFSSPTDLESGDRGLQWFRNVTTGRFVPRDGDKSATKQLWVLANMAEGADRDAVLEELAKVLIDQKKLEKALGVAKEINTVATRLPLMAEIAGRDKAASDQ